MTQTLDEQMPPHVLYIHTPYIMDIIGDAYRIGRMGGCGCGEGSEAGAGAGGQH